MPPSDVAFAGIDEYVHFAEHFVCSALSHAGLPPGTSGGVDEAGTAAHADVDLERLPRT